MNDKFPPEFGRFEMLSSDPAERKEQLTDCFGAIMFWIRDFVLKNATDAMQNETIRKSMGTIRRKPYDGVAQLTKEEQAAALEFAEAVLDNFGHLLAWHFSSAGNDLRATRDLAIRMKLVLEVVDPLTDNLVAEETINRGGKRVFGDNWGRWLNLFR